jgi:hypothetical protein
MQSPAQSSDVRVYNLSSSQTQKFLSKIQFLGPKKIRTSKKKDFNSLSEIKQLLEKLSED